MNINSEVLKIGEKSNGLQVFVDEDTDNFVINECYSDLNQFNLRCYSIVEGDKRNVLLYANPELGVYSWEGFGDARYDDENLWNVNRLYKQLTDHINEKVTNNFTLISIFVSKDVSTGLHVFGIINVC
jgi:hypothetical protein